MKIFIISYKRPNTITTPQLFEEAGVECLVFVHNEEDRNAYLDARRFTSLIIKTKMPPGIGGQKRWIMDHYMNENEWALFIDDNVTSFSALAKPWYDQATIDLNDGTPRKEWEERYKNPISTLEFLGECQQLQEHCEDVGAHIGGFAMSKSTFYRGKKYNYCALLIGKVLVQQKCKASYDPSYYTNDDFQISLEHLYYYGKIVRHNYIWADFPRYMAGGLGKIQDRYGIYAEAIKQLMVDYPNALNLSHRKDMPYGSSCRLRIREGSGLINWRRAMQEKRGELLEV